MKTKARFAAASGKEQDESMVRMDYNTAKKVGNVRYGKYFVFYLVVSRWVYVDYNDIIWAYRRTEDSQSKLCRGSKSFEMHSIMLVIKDKKRIGIPVGDKENTIVGLNIVQENNKFVDIGFSKEKEEKYL